MSELRVLHVIDSFDLGGGQTALWNLLEHLDREKFACEVAAMHGRGVFHRKFLELGIPVHSLAASKWSPAHMLRLCGMARQFDITHFHLFGSNWLGKPAAALGGCRIRFNHDQCNDAFRSESRLRTGIDRLTNHLSTHVCAVSRSTRDFLIHNEHLPAEKVTHLPNPVDSDYFRPPSDDERSAARRHWNASSAETQITAVGRLHPQKDFLTAIAAVADLPKDATWRLVIAGTGPEEPQLRHACRERGITDRVHFAGHVEDMRSLLWASDILLMPSLYEGLPVALLEAMACGIPAVASAVDGIEEIVTHDRTGLLAPPQQAPQFTTQLERLLANADLRPTLARQARQLMTETFDARVISRRLEALYLTEIQRQI